MPIKFDTILLSLSGSPLKEGEQVLTVGNVLASILDTAPGNLIDRAVAYDLAKRCYKNLGEVTQDELDLLTMLVRNSNVPSNVILGQVLEALQSPTVKEK